MSTMTSEQKKRYQVQLIDGMKRPAEADESEVPVRAESSDPTVVEIAGLQRLDVGKWEFWAVSVLPGSAKVVFSADGQFGEGINSLVAEDDIEVTEDERTKLRTIEMTSDEAVDEV